MLGAVLACAPSPAVEREAGGGEGDLAAARLGAGWVVWESNRSGAFRIWIRPLAGGPARQLSPDEAGRDHCCAHLSPDGARVAYLAIPRAVRGYTEPWEGGELRLLEVDGRRARVLARSARHYGEHRAAIWWGNDELVYIDGKGATRLADLSMGTERVLARGPERGEGFLIDPTGRWATSSTATFSERDTTTGAIRLATPYGGCQAWPGTDGEVGFWAAGAGGPIDAIELATRRTWTILAKHDRRLPADRGYLYFPMVTRDRTLLAFGASNDEHDHFRSDYDIFVIELDPAILLPAGQPVRVTAHEAVDRFPDLWRSPSAQRRRQSPPRRQFPIAAAGEARASGPGAGWPATSDGLVFVWEGADRLNRYAPTAASEMLTALGSAWADRRGRMVLDGGSFEAGRDSAERVASALKASNTVTVELVVEPASLAPGVRGTLLALGSPRQRGLLVTQSGPALELRIRTGPTGAWGGATPAPLARLDRRRAVHVAFTYSPGRLRTYVDGQLAGSPQWAGDFFPWRARELVFGAEPGAAERFRGALSHVAIFARELAADEIAADASRALAALAGSPVVAAAEVEGRLVARARIPSLDEISPYRSALVVETWAVERVLAGRIDGARVRVARWALLDGQPTAAMALAAGARARLRLEPFTAQPQLESVVLSEAGVGAGAGSALWFDAGPGAGS